MGQENDADNVSGIDNPRGGCPFPTAGLGMMTWTVMADSYRLGFSNEWGARYVGDVNPYASGVTRRQ
jgi:hypothetical protein